jgi:uridine kinase
MDKDLLLAAVPAATIAFLTGLGVSKWLALPSHSAPAADTADSPRRRRRSLVQRDVGTGAHHGSFVIVIGGASGSGKTSLSSIMRDHMPPDLDVVCIPCDNYYKGLEEDEDPANHNFDHPDSLDFDLLAEHLQALGNGEAIEMPLYDFSTHQRLTETEHVEPADVVIVDGIFTLWMENVRSVCDLRVFTVEDLDVCLARRLRRDIVERGRSIESVLVQYQRFVKPAYHNFIRPSMIHADIIIPRARDNTRAIDLLVQDVVRRCRALRDVAAARPHLMRRLQAEGTAASSKVVADESEGGE